MLGSSHVQFVKNDRKHNKRRCLGSQNVLTQGQGRKVLLFEPGNLSLLEAPFGPDRHTYLSLNLRIHDVTDGLLLFLFVQDPPVLETVHVRQDPAQGNRLRNLRDRKTAALARSLDTDLSPSVRLNHVAIVNLNNSSLKERWHDPLNP